MRLSDAIDLFIADWQAAGRINSPRTETAYRHVLVAHAEDVANRDAALTGRRDVIRTLRRWPAPNTQRVRRAALVSFYEWMVEEGMRPANPARQTRRPRKQPTSVYRLTDREANAMLAAANTKLERRAVHIGLLAGLRVAELRGLQGLHFQRPGFVWVSAQIGKGGRERWVPIAPRLDPVADDIVATVAPAHYVLPRQVTADPPFNRRRRPDATRPMGGTTLYRLVVAVGERAGIRARVNPHLLRHAYGDRMARAVGIELTQALMGHAAIETTRGYLGDPTLDELAAAVRRLSPRQAPREPNEATAGIEPADRPLRPPPGETPPTRPREE